MLTSLLRFGPSGITGHSHQGSVPQFSGPSVAVRSRPAWLTIAPHRSRVSPFELRHRFTQLVIRRQRRSDATFSLDGTRFELPERIRRLDKVALRYASWDLSHFWLCNERRGRALPRIFPLDNIRNPNGQRRALPQGRCIATLSDPHPSSTEEAEPVQPGLAAATAPAGRAPLHRPAARDLPKANHKDSVGAP